MSCHQKAPLLLLDVLQEHILIESPNRYTVPSALPLHALDPNPIPQTLSGLSLSH